jgi:hypothetical protein
MVTVGRTARFSSVVETMKAVEAVGEASQGSEVPVANEFPDVFPKELLGMPPDRDI